MQLAVSWTPWKQNSTTFRRLRTWYLENHHRAIHLWKRKKSPIAIKIILANQHVCRMGAWASPHNKNHAFPSTFLHPGLYDECTKLTLLLPELRYEPHVCMPLILYVLPKMIFSRRRSSSVSRTVSNNHNHSCQWSSKGTKRAIITRPYWVPRNQSPRYHHPLANPL